MLIFSPHEMKYIWYLPKKSKFSFYFILNGNTEITTLLFTWSFLVRFDFCSVFIGYNIEYGLNISCAKDFQNLISMVT